MSSTQKCLIVCLASLSLCLPRMTFADPVGTKSTDKTSPEAAAAGLQTCNVYVQFDNPSDQLLSVGFANLVVANSPPNATNTDGGFYQHPIGSDLPPNCAFCSFPGFELLCSDSFVTIGSKCSPANVGIDPDWDSALFNTIGGGSGVVGGWKGLPPAGMTDANLQVLIAQFTVTAGGAITGPLTLFYNTGQPFPTTVHCPPGDCECVSSFDCDDGNPCTDDICNPDCSCSSIPNSASCSDGLFCNGADTCSGGSCSIHAGNPCPGPDGDTNCAESCNEATDSCTSSDPNGTPCGVCPSAGCICTYPDTCSGGVCQKNDEPNGVFCDDSIFCNGSDSCYDGLCSVHSGNPCPGPDGDANCAESCNETSDICNAPDPNGSPCHDGDACTEADACSGGLCSGTPVICPPGCSCVGGFCLSCGSNSDCNDGIACTQDTCVAGGSCSTCVSTPIDAVCDDSNPCTTETCDPDNGCVYTANSDPCDDGDACTFGDMCSAGGCAGVPGCSADADCDDADPATADSCAGGCCEHAPSGGIAYPLDIKPGKCPNKVKLGTGGGDVQIFIAGDADSDVGLIDLDSIRLRLCGGSASIDPSKPPRTKDKVTPLLTTCGDCTCHKKKKDYIDDVEIKFKKSELSALIGPAVAEGELVDLEVYGTLLDGSAFTAHDCILVDRPGSDP